VIAFLPLLPDAASQIQMKTMSNFSLPALALVFLLAANNSPAADPQRVTENFDANWLFLKADATNAEQNQFDDSAWRKLNVPHDWSIEGPFAETNPAGGAGAFLPSGVVWYRKHFSLPENFSNRCTFVEFDGVMANSDVWINGFHLGHRPYGYVSFNYELTGHLNFGSDNVLAVRADTSQQPASRWYAGAGIYRHVRLVATDPVHIVENGVFISTPQVSAEQATVHVQTTVTNESDSSEGIFIVATVLDSTGKIVGSAETYGQSLEAGKSAQIDKDIVVKNPQLWNLDDPILYRAAVAVKAGINGPISYTIPKLLDTETNFFGIRDAHFDADTGFWLNGKNFKVKGVCLHADGGAFGAAVPLSVWEARLKTLKSLGVNAIRTAHNPPAPEFLDLCDRMGFLVMDEMFDCWTVAKNPYDYHLYFNKWAHTDERDTILRDRNHPSIILYSVGNEIHDTPQAEKAKAILKGLVEVAHSTDLTRPVTMALFRPNVSHDYDDGLADMLDVIGQNYRENEILAAHAQKPSRKIIGTENQHSRAAWLALRDNPPYAGQFLWSGIDYLGESRRWPVIGAGSGLLDRTGAPKPMAFERQSWWSGQPMVFIARRVAPSALLPTDPGYEPPSQDALRRPQVLFHDWTPRNLQPHDENVEIYSNCKTVELFLNGKSLGAKEINADASPRNWSVPFAPGKIKAVARDENGKLVAMDELRTAGAPAKIVLSANKKEIADDWNDVCEITAKITDKNGIIVPTADDLVSFKISGAGVIAAVDNADNSSDEPFQAGERRAFQGRCVAFVKATAPSGKIILAASTAGLKPAKIKITSRPVEINGGLAAGD
jgi:beta-galactosidase